MTMNVNNPVPSAGQPAPSADPAPTPPAGNVDDLNPGQNQPPKPEPTEPQPPKEPQPNIEPKGDDIKDAVENAGLDINELSNQWNEGGKLSDDAYKALEGIGFSKDTVNQICGVLAENTATEVKGFKSKVAEAIGGEKVKERLIQFFTEDNSIPQDKKAELNSMIRMDNLTQSIAAMKEIKAMYEEKYGNTGNLLGGDVGGTGDESDVFKSRKEQSEAIVKAYRSGDKSLIKAAGDKAARTSRHNRKNGITF